MDADGIAFLNLLEQDLANGVTRGNLLRAIQLKLNPIDTTNLLAIGNATGSVVIGVANNRTLTPDQALVTAAWLIVQAEAAAGTAETQHFADVLGLVRTAATGGT